MSPDPTSHLLQLLKADPASILRDGHKEVFLARAPGRLDVMGGLSEYAGSLACQLPLQAATAVALQRRDDRQLVIQSYNLPAPDNIVALSLDDFYGTASLLPIDSLQKLFAKNPWAAHIAGAYPTLGKHKKITRRTPGANIACHSDLPFRAGAASSAALQCATLWALTAAYHLILDPLEIALLAQKIENQIVGGRAGIMEPAVSVLGREGQLLLLQCQPHEHMGYVPVPAGLMFAGLQFDRPDATDSDPSARHTRISSFIAQAIIARFHLDTGIKKDPTKGYLANVSPDTFTRYFAKIIPESVTGEQFLKDHAAADGAGGYADRLTTVDPAAAYFPRAAAAFHIHENARTQTFINHLRALNELQSPAEHRRQAFAAGALMLESHAAAFEEARLANADADLLVRLVTARGPDQGLYGAKTAGGESGGGVTVLAESTALPQVEAIAEEFQQRTGRKIHVLTGSSAGTAEAAPQRLALSDFH